MDFKNVLKAKHFTQTALAKLLGVTQSLVSQWVTGTCRPQLDIIPKLSAILEIPVNEIIIYFAK